MPYQSCCKIPGKLADFVEGEACKVVGVKEEIETFERRIEKIKAFLQHAERQHGDTILRAWVMESKDLMYDADDIFDVFMLRGGYLLEARPSASLFICFLPASDVSNIAMR
ncbi:Disease resistance protein [Musa troglodytarum]|uniref:Disease resistance protein n=1 Tax=Musa troglodytarum TaxID=320322 RepID=A0A9E7HFV1_9LILI|nr:Disease resistance protein [Musa troglodytarum]